MIESYAFRTRARTVDHLGREQIADCPTAISELWKNAYDAYATSVSLTIFEGKNNNKHNIAANDNVPVIACLLDNGHGMSREDFFDKWLVIGTESKASGGEVSDSDRKGLPLRVRQGQKGIGRLSAAALGPLLLFVSKRQKQKFVAALIDWRIFENPYLYLEDVVVPVAEFENKQELWDVLPDLFEEMMSNVWGTSNISRNNQNSKNHAERTLRIVDAWKKYDNQEKIDGNQKTTREKIEQVLISTVFQEDHIDKWDPWNSSSGSGTALLVADAVFDLEAQLLSENSTAMTQAGTQAKSLLFQTLSSFIDPFARIEDQETGYGAANFDYRVETKSGILSRPIISVDKNFNLEELEGLEHILDGKFNKDGVFIGRVKAFGQWVEAPFIVPPAIELGKRNDSQVGEFLLRVGSYEGDKKNSTMTEDFFSTVEEKAKNHAGLKVYRDGLRVLPYGREANDFFEIEKRRTLHAGRNFWSIRRMFGRVGITRNNNQNLKDKAGREGLIDNKAAKIFRDLVENVLITAARQYFGEKSDIRADFLAKAKVEYEKKRAEIGQKNLKTRQRKEFSSRLNKFIVQAEQLTLDLNNIEKDISSSASNAEEAALIEWQEALQAIQNMRSEMTFPSGSVPQNQGALSSSYKEFRTKMVRADESIGRLKDSITVALKKVNPDSPRDIAYSRLQSHAAYLQGRVRKWGNNSKSLLVEETQRLEKLIDEKMSEFHASCKPKLDSFLQENISLEELCEFMEKERERIDLENNDQFSSYIDTLEMMRESVNLSEVALFSVSEKEETSTELSRLHSLAQLGITVEIVSHEMDGLETSIVEALRTMTPQCQDTQQYIAIKYATKQIGDRLRFLSPLKLSGDRRYEVLTGRDIYAYVTNFLEKVLLNSQIEVKASAAFMKFSIRELPSRIYPVFVNLINNSIYWASGKPNSLIVLDVVDMKIVVSDNGPGIGMEEVSRLFTLFYTTKIRGGRGVGLYLSRSNLATAGHSIYYAREEAERLLPGANFVIKLLGAKYE